jgi:hypothetical protein
MALRFRDVSLLAVPPLFQQLLLFRLPNSSRANPLLP